MNYRIANKEVCNALIDKKVVIGYDVDENTVFVTADRYCGFIIPKTEIAYNITKMQHTEELFDLSSFIKPENIIKPTMNYLKSDRDFCRRFDGKNWHVFIKEKFLKKLDKNESYCFFQNYKEGKDMSKQSILAAAEVYHTGDDNYKYIPAMIFCPICLPDYDRTHY